MSLPKILLGAALAALCSLALPAGALAAANPWLDVRLINFAHQGGEDEYPSNTMFALKSSMRNGADMLELDVGWTKDGKLIVTHDNKVDRTTNGTGSVNDLTLAEIQRLDGAYWFVQGENAVKGRPASDYRFRGIRTGQKRPPRGFSRSDFRIPTLAEVFRAFPRTPMNIEIKGKDGRDASVYVRGAELLAAELKRAKRSDVIVASFEQVALDRFHALMPKISLAPSTAGVTRFVLGGDPGPGVKAFQVPITATVGGRKVTVASPTFVQAAHERGYAVHVWLSNDVEDVATYRRLVSMCVDGIMAAKPDLLGRFLRRNGWTQVNRPTWNDPCGTQVAARSARASGGAVTLPLRRAGESLEKRSGTVALVARKGNRGLRSGTVLGRARWSLGSGATETTASVALNRAGRAALKRGSVRAQAQVRQPFPAFRGSLTIR
jgi:glycerophosphoryl diester phosphodiesterase